MKKRKVIAILMVSMMAVSLLAGCNKSNTADTAATTTDTAAATTSAEPEAVVTDMATTEEAESDGVWMVSADGSMTICVPDSTWQETPNDEVCVAFSDGTNAILMEHYIAGEEAPEVLNVDMGEAGGTYQTLLTQGGYIISVTGVADSDETLESVKAAVNSVIIDTTKLDSDEGETEGEAAESTDTSTASTQKQTTHTVQQDQYSISDVNYTKYVAVAQLTVRSSGSTSAAPLGVLGLNQQVTVTGEVLKNGASSGWVRISYNGSTGYVASTYLSSTQVAVTATGKTITLYDGNGNAVTVSAYNDGSYKDANGNTYTSQGNQQWKCSNGSTYYSYKTSSGATKTNSSMVLYTSNATPVTVYQYSDGSWRDGNGVIYKAQNENTYVSADGKTTLLTYINEQPTEKTGTYTVTGVAQYLALRSYPSYAADNEIGQLKNGETFTVTNTSNGTYWYGYNSSNVYGYVDSRYLTR